MPSSARHSILVVDPDPSVSVLLVAFLRLKGYDSEAANTASDALRLSRRRQHSVVLLEPRIPRGESLLEDLQSTGRNAESNVILITTSDGPADAYVAPPSVRSVLFKPVHLEKLAAVLEVCCDVSSTQPIH